MQWVGRIFDIYVKGSVHVALAVSSIMYISAHFLNIFVSRPLYFFVFFSTIPTYNIIKHSVQVQNRFFGLLPMSRSILFLSVISSGFALYFLAGLDPITWVGILALALLTALYTLPILPKRKNLRHLGIVKILIIGCVWAGTAVFLPVLDSGYPFSGDVWLEFVQRFFMILVLMVPFEIRDLGIDPLDMRTIPQRIGIGRTRKIGLLLCAICFSLNYLEENLTGIELFAEGLMLLSLATLLILLPKKQGAYFASFWVEALPICWALVLWIATRWA